MYQLKRTNLTNENHRVVKTFNISEKETNNSKIRSNSHDN